MTPEEHNKYISWTFLANGLFQGTMLLVIFGFVISMFLFGPPDDGFPQGFFAIIFSFILLINLAFISPNFIAYDALKNRKPWARVASIVAAVFAATNVPIGTASCVYALWFFVGEEWKSIYPESSSGAQDPRLLESAERRNWDGRYENVDGETVFRPAEPPDWR